MHLPSTFKNELTCLKIDFLTLKGPITTAADDKFCNVFLIFENKVYFMRIVCQQTILMKYHALFVIFEKVAKFDLSFAANYRWRF